MSLMRISIFPVYCMHYRASWSCCSGTVIEWQGPHSGWPLCPIVAKYTLKFTKHCGNGTSVKTGLLFIFSRERMRQ